MGPKSISLVAAMLLVAGSGCAYIDRASHGPRPDSAARGVSNDPTLSGDGRHVAFQSSATDLGPTDVNGQADIYVHDQQSDTSELVSVATDGSPANLSSFRPSISRNGQIVAFDSQATNFAPVTVGSSVFVRDRDAHTTTLVDDGSFAGQVTGDGTAVAYLTNFELTGDTNGHADVYLKNPMSGTRTVVSVGANGSQVRADVGAYAVSNTGRYVAFTDGPFLVPNTSAFREVYLRDVTSATTTLVSIPFMPGIVYTNVGGVGVSDDGRYVTFAADWGGFGPGAPHGHDVFVFDDTTSSVTLLSAPGSNPDTTSKSPRISADGLTVAFLSNAPLVPEDQNGLYDVYSSDTRTKHLTLISTTKGFSVEDGNAISVALSADGRYAAMATLAGNLDPTDLNGNFDVYIAATHRPRIASVSPATIARPGTFVLDVTGNDLDAVSLVYFADPSVTVDAFQPLDPEHGKLTVTTTNATPSGSFTPMVWQFGNAWNYATGTWTYCGACLAIT